MESERKNYVTGAGFKVGARVKLKMSPPPCCGYEVRVHGVIVGKGKDGIKWSVHIDGETKLIDVRSEDLLLLEE